MKLALIGYGKMGGMVELAAVARGIEVVAVIDPSAGSRGSIREADVCVEFSEPDAVVGNVRLATEAGLPLVVGTTGWHHRLDEVSALVDAAGTGLVYGSNFSIGVNLTYRIVRQAAALFKRFDSYDPYIEEAHHKFKKDAPSGTALNLKKLVDGEYGRETPVASTRAGYLPGTHVVGFDSEADTVTITHVARTRAGLADGAILAAQWIAGRRGVFEFSDVIESCFEL